MNQIVSREQAELVWDQLARDMFTAARLRVVTVGETEFKVLHLPRTEEFVPDVYVRTGLSFYAWPRLAGYRHRFVLTPADVLAGPERGGVTVEDVLDWIAWSAHMRHVVTFSTYKSGASYPFGMHAQSFPLHSETGTLSALTESQGRAIVDFGAMPHFGDIRIEVLEGYPARGLRILTRDGDGARMQAARKVFELAVNYDGMKAFNAVILPREDGPPAVHFFPRRKDGRATYGPGRWQIAALEINGLMQAKDRAAAEAIDADTIRDIFVQTTPDERQFEEFLNLIDSF